MEYAVKMHVLRGSLRVSSPAKVIVKNAIKIDS